MNTIRREQMLEFIRTKGKVSVKELSQMFSSVSIMTIHRDLEHLREKGVIDRVRGGAKYSEPDEGTREPAFNEREVANREQKLTIARKAAELIHGGSAIYIDSGTTAAALSALIPNIPISVVTNSPNIAVSLANRSFINVMLCGGALEKKNLSLYGSAAIQAIEKINIDIAFVVASGFSEECGFTCGNDGEAVIKNLVCRKARNVALMLDSSKLDTVLPFTFAALDDIDYFICDKPLPEELALKFKQNGIKIL